MEKQKNSLLSEEVKIKKGTVERLRSELENTKEQLEYIKEEKGKKKTLCCRPLVNHLVGERLSLHLVPKHWCLVQSKVPCALSTSNCPRTRSRLCAWA